MPKARAIQARAYQGNVLHVQGQGPSTNRPYGVAENLNVPEDFLTWLANQPHPRHSLAGTGAAYATGEIVLLDDETLRLIIHGEPINHDNGAVLTIQHAPALRQYMDSIPAAQPPSAEF